MKLNKSRKPSQTRWHLMEPGGICKTRGRQREVEVNRAATVTGRSIDGTFWTSAERRRFTFRHVTDWWQGEANERTSSMERYRTNRSPVTGRTDRCTPAMIKKKNKIIRWMNIFFSKKIQWAAAARAFGRGRVPSPGGKSESLGTIYAN